MSKCDVAIIGAGPYGLSASAHLRTIKGLDVHTFGEPMAFWVRNMPIGMLLRSGWAASHIADPNESLTLDSYRAASGNHFSSPVPLNRFIDYGLWYQSQAVPDLDQRKIALVEAVANGFELMLEVGESILARRVSTRGCAETPARAVETLIGIRNVFSQRSGVPAHKATSHMTRRIPCRPEFEPNKEVLNALPRNEECLTFLVIAHRVQFARSSTL